MNTSPKIDALFAKTRPVCFGRFVMDVPANADLIFGGQAFGPNIETFENGSKDLKKLASSKKTELEAIKHREEVGSLFRSEVDGPTEGSWTLLFWSSRNSTYTTDVWGYLSAPPHGFLYKGLASPIDGRPLEGEVKKLTYVANNLRARQPDEVPTEPGVCLDLGFIKDDGGKFQEIFNIGLRFPSLPDVSFSISSNKDARRDTSFEERRNEAKKAALMHAPLATLFGKVKTLREGKHDVFRWKGDEALFRRPLDDERKGVWHEFQFEYPGIRYDHHNPGWEAALFTGVKGNTAGAQASSLTDDEAIALWDRLLATVRLRVPN
ncbi:T6SS immunity protein Tli4 family protein [Uliginosibacterium paludis]|uniref:T6SS immunity protein Tli4 family protein n=1 Tax=Uliginosibacterium paludis TaxID=1615952 RepID=A0ABV2CR52_9RHOO